MGRSLTFAIGGEAGFGIMSAGLLFSKLCARSGMQIFDYAEYPSLIRGGHNVMFVHFSPEEVFSQEQGIDLLAALNRESFHFHKSSLKESSGVIFDPEDFPIQESEVDGKKIKWFPVPLKKIVGEVDASAVAINNVVLGAAAALFGLDLGVLLGVINDYFSDKGRQVIEENQKAARAGYEYAASQNWGSWRKLGFQPVTDRRQVVITGNEALALGALSAGCQFYASYPMTPSTSILHFLAQNGPDFGMIVRQAEDEIGVINEAVGASFAGVRSMVGTSGGGFALMVEALSLTGMTETPLVIVVSQRPGSSTGMPTWTEAADLQFIIRAGHGEFPKIVLAPGDPAEVFALTREAFNLADIYQCPVFIVLDKYLSESHKSVEMSNVKCQMSNLAIDRGKVEMTPPPSEGIEPFLRYKLTEDGISPRILPGTRGFFYQANSYEHLEDGFTTESAQDRKKQVEKRMAKTATYLKNHAQGATLYGSAEADITLVGWGSVRSPVLEAIKSVEAGSRSAGQFNFLHFTHLWPFPRDKAATPLQKAKRLVLVENNATGQFGQLLSQETGIEIKDRLLKYDGRPFYPEEISEYLKDIWK